MDDLKSACDEIRAQLQIEKAQVLNLKSYGGNGEVMANIMLAYRHLEDARMRIGKALQADTGGTSIYDCE